MLRSCTAYDAALQSGVNSDLVEALWRNVYDKVGNREDASTLAVYVNRELACLNMTESEPFIQGRIRFSGQHRSVTPVNENNDAREKR